jgi:O-antigen/teichoic acid export membrane protein
MLNRLAKLPKPLRDSLIYASALAFSKGLALLMVPVATNYLTPQDYGRLDVLQTLADLLSIIIGMGLAESLFRFAGSETNTDERKQAAANLFGMAVISGVLTLIITQVCAPWIASTLPGNISPLEARLILVSLALCSVVLMPLAWLRLQEKAGLYFLGSAGMVLLQVSIAIPLLMLGFGVHGVLIGTLISTVILSSVLIYVQYKDTGIAFNFARFKSYSCYGGPLIFVGIAGFILGSFDRWILADEVGTAAMADYALAAKFGLMTAVLIQPFDLWWHARRFSCYAEKNGAENCARYASIGIVIALFSCLIISMLGPVLVRLLTPVSYYGAIQYIPWLALLAAIHNATSTLAFGAMSATHTIKPALIDSSAAALALVAYFILIPMYHAWGAIASTYLALVSRLILMYIVSQKERFLPFPLFKLMSLSLFSLCALILIPTTELSLSVFIQSILLLLSFLGASIFLGFIPIKQIQLVMLKMQGK